MSKIALTPNAAGTAAFTLAAPATNTDRTLTLPDATTTLVGTDATQTLSNKTIAASQLTGALPAIDGSALTGVGSLTLLGTLATTSGTSVTLSGLNLTSYKQLQYSINGISNSSTGGVYLKLNNYIVSLTAQTVNTDLVYGGGIINLSNGVFWGASLLYSSGGGAYINNPFNGSGLSGLTTASTSITFTVVGAFTAGSITIYGVK